MHRAGRAALALHFDDVGHAAPGVRHGFRRPLVRPLAHRRRRRDGVNGDHLACAISDMRDRLVSVHRLELALHDIPRSEFHGGHRLASPYLQDAGWEVWMSGRGFTHRCDWDHKLTAGCRIQPEENPVATY